ncbi:Selenoprotein Klike, partial [Caligus rogercresseyi]
MVYITNDGQVLDSRPWSLASIKDSFWGLVQFVILFFSTLFQPDYASKNGSAS